ncbi:hypothetical protein THAR02_00351 [Trichoderma harzianum]|uniref:Uncharacterized protein n=1 Tax=Trichoderma harzianum TaxID=5544 RepID=A0A0F9XST3_TRIHA|nr:hypothetical protein THAR02_00351 [Trichoderma harzianum]
MAPTVIKIHDEGGGQIHANPVPDNPDRSQTENEAQPAKTPSRRRSGDKRPNYKERSNGDSGSASDTDEAGDEYMGSKGDIPAKKPNVTQKKTPRALRSQEGEQEPTSSEQQKQRPAPTTRLIVRSSKRSHDDHESEPTRPAKRGPKPSANTEIKRFEKEALGLLDRYKSKANDLETARSEIQNLQGQVKDLKSALEQAQEAHKQSEILNSQKITQLKNDSREWRCQLASALEAEKKDTGKYVKVPDSDIKQGWLVLSYNIRDLVTQCLRKIPDNQDTILESLVMERRLLSIDDMSALRTCILRRAGDIGDTLTQCLFLKSYNHRTNPKYLEIISQIRSSAVADLSDDEHLNIEAMEILIDKVTERLDPFIPNSKMDYFKNEVRRLVTKAVDFHLMMMKSKAMFFIEWIGDDDGKQLAPFDQTKMAPHQYDRGADVSNSFVKFVEAPALVKYGTADGDKFDTSMVLCKSQVTLEEDDDDTGEDGGDTGGRGGGDNRRHK